MSFISFLKTKKNINKINKVETMHELIPIPPKHDISDNAVIITREIIYLKSKFRDTYFFLIIKKRQIVTIK